MPVNQGKFETINIFIRKSVKFIKLLLTIAVMIKKHSFSLKLYKIKFIIVYMVILLQNLLCKEPMLP